jgi:hypothetical protein
MHDTHSGERDAIELRPPEPAMDVRAALADQKRLQARMDRQRMTWWMPMLFAIGLAFATIGLIAAISESRDLGSPTVAVFGFGLFVLLFGSAVASWAIHPLFYRPRLVPYFSREIGPYGGDTMTAFKRGRGLYREIAALDEHARRLGVTPLSHFGFAYDYYGQDVRWHPASDGLRSVDALRQPEGAPRLATDVAEDLAALALALRAATEQGAEFSVVLRLHGTENMQAVCTLEPRQGTFW